MDFVSLENAWHVAEHVAAVATAVGAGAWWLIQRVQSAKAETLSSIAQMRENDLKHIDDKMDTVNATCTRVEQKVEQVDGRLNQHVQWHLDHS